MCLLGRPATAVAGKLEPLKLRPKAMALLAYLALSHGAIARRTLARLVFQGAGDPIADLRWHLSYLRAACPPLVTAHLRSNRESIDLEVPTDVALFRRGIETLQRSADSPDASRILELYRDDLLLGLSVSASPEFDTWMYIEQESLRRLFGQATMRFTRQVMESERIAEAVGPLSRLVSVDPYLEEGHVLLIETLEALQMPALAAAAYDRYQRIVRTELGAQPRPSLVLRFEGAVAPGNTLPVEELVPLKQVTIHIVEWPGDEPVVLGIHGSGMLAHSLGGIAEQLAPSFRCISVDLRGHGSSDKPPGGYDLNDHVKDILELVDELDLKRPILLGHSAGGTIATYVSTRVPVSGLILLEAMIGERAFTENAAALLTPYAEGLEHDRFGGFAQYLAQWRASRPRWSDEAEHLADRWVHHALAPLPDGRYRSRVRRGALEAEWASIIAGDSLGELSRVRCPVLIVQGLQPFIGGMPYFTDKIVAHQRRAAVHADLFVATRSDHSSMVRNPEPEMIERIRLFIENCARVTVASNTSSIPYSRRTAAQKLS
ncbi:MAG: hypothetical protein NVSMB52_07510 [Chloroflexota bacterium]